MLIPIKIQCGCGQRYAFDAEADADLGLHSVVCPVCGADGTKAANEIIARNRVVVMESAAAAVAAEVEAPRVRLAVSHSTPTPRPTRQLPQMDPEKARAEARAKMHWGDSPDMVTGYLRMQGFSKEDASTMVRELVKERVSAVRGIGVRKILTGIALMMVPIITLIVFLCVGVILLKVMAVAIMVALWGVWRLINGIIMFLAPKSQPGDLADQ